MCIRDSSERWGETPKAIVVKAAGVDVTEQEIIAYAKENLACLLYTSDAADERSSVDLGGRRIIKKKQKKRTDHVASTQWNTK